MDHRKVSKFLSFILRHNPDSIGLTLDANGWAKINDIIDKSDMALTQPLIAQVVANNDKQRFALSDDGQRIRANQGHSINVDMKFEPVIPPDLLYHGTATRFVDTILQEGLKPMARQHVHLSGDPDTARKVGTRHGKAVILRVDAAGMHAADHVFHCSKNGVWLTAHVATGYLSIAD